MTLLNLSSEMLYYKRKFEVLKKLEQLVIEKGYTWIEPSLFEDYDQFMEINSRIPTSQMLKLIHPRGQVSILSPDITTSLMQTIIPKYKQKEVLKLFYHSYVFSVQKNGEIKEVKQFGVEHLGEDEACADAKVVTLALEILEAFNIDYLVEMNHSQLIESLLKGQPSALKDEHKIKEMLYYKRQEQLKQLVKSRQYDNLVLLSELIHFQGNLSEFKKQWERLKFNKEIVAVFDELSTFEQGIDETLRKRMTFDGSLISEFDYYEGITFKCYSKKTGRLLLQGGRYDKLTESFGKKVPAIGFSLNLEDLMEEISNDN